jgi:hypothetical protein
LRRGLPDYDPDCRLKILVSTNGPNPVF